MLPTIQTYSGRFINFVDHSQNEYAISDIAHALSNLCRFTGHCKSFYSVAQHCVLASYLVDKPLAMEALLHDRIEAYMGDMSSPLKNLVPDFKRIEHSLEAHSAKTFGLPSTMTSDVKVADLTMLVTEKRDIMVDVQDAEEWYWLVSSFVPLEEIITPWSPHTAKNMFLARFFELIDDHCQLVGIENNWK